jgi:hypothetical protein
VLTLLRIGGGGMRCKRCALHGGGGVMKEGRGMKGERGIRYKGCTVHRKEGREEWEGDEVKGVHNAKKGEA